MDNYDYYLVTRPLFSKFEKENDIPVMRNEFNDLDLDKCAFLNFSNIAKAKENSVILTFHHDKKINCLWNDPLKYIRKLKGCAAVITPDFTVQRGMDIELIRFNVYRNRWLGCTWQQYGITAIPSISWAGPETYRICFSGICKNSIVAVSTIGCRKPEEKKIFIEGYNELLKQKSPRLILCFGKIIEGMTGNIFPIDYDEGFGVEEKYDFIPLFEMSRILKVEGGDNYGW